MKIHLITVATEQTQELERYINSAIYYGFTPTILGLGDEWSGGHSVHGRLEYPGGGMKVNLLKDHLNSESFNDDDLLIFTDSYDVVTNGSPQKTVELWEKYGSDYVVFGAEKTCWPDESLMDKYPEPLSDYPYLNSGNFIGKIKDVKKMLTTSILDSDDDQEYYTHLFLNNDVDIRLDYTQIFFQCLSKSEDDVSINEDGFLFNIKSGNIPVFVHGNGGKSTRLFLNTIFNKMRQFNDFAIEYDTKPNIQINYLLESEENINLLLDNFELISSPHKFFKINLFTNNKKVLWFLDTFKKKNTNGGYIDVIYLNLDGYDIRNQIFDQTIHNDVDIVLFMDDNIQLRNDNIFSFLPYKLYNGVVSPMLNMEKSLLSNFWCGVDSDGYYGETPDYFQYRDFKDTGTFYVPYVSNIIMYDPIMFDVLRNSFFIDEKDKEKYGNDYYVVMMKNLRDRNVLTYINNEKYYGRMLK